MVGLYLRVLIVLPGWVIPPGVDGSRYGPRGGRRGRVKVNVVNVLSL